MIFKMIYWAQQGILLSLEKSVDTSWPCLLYHLLKRKEISDVPYKEKILFIFTSKYLELNSKATTGQVKH